MSRKSGELKAQTAALTGRKKWEPSKQINTSVMSKTRLDEGSGQGGQEHNVLLRNEKGLSEVS